MIITPALVESIALCTKTPMETASAVKCAARRASHASALKTEAQTFLTATSSASPFFTFGTVV